MNTDSDVPMSVTFGHDTAAAALVASPEHGPISEPGVFRAETRTKQVLVRLTPTEHAELLATCEQTGMSAPDLLRAGWRYLKYLDDQARRLA